MSDRSLRIHGVYYIRRTGRVLEVKAEGPWNEDAAIQYRLDLEQSICELEPEPWGQILIFTGEAILTPEAETRLEEITVWRMSRGLTQLAIVLEDVLNRSLVESQFHGIYNRVGIRYQFIDDRQQALDWMSAAGLPAGD